MSKVDTINYQGKDYATVPARLKEFRSMNPRASISTVPKFLDDGGLMFQATIIADRADDSSATATGTAMYTASEMSGKKQFEKLETISIGRALAVLGYLNNGEVATGEEMAEFEDYKEDKKATAKSLAIESLEASKTIEELKLTFIGLGEFMTDQDVVAVKDAMKVRLNENN